MASKKQGGGQHGQFLLLLAVSGVSEKRLNLNAKGIHDAYMRKFGAFGAFTVSHLTIGQMIEGGSNKAADTQWTHLIRYFGPASSVEWLKKEILAVARETRAEATMQTFTVSDLTGRF
jgi:hypothetical protein